MKNKEVTLFTALLFATGLILLVQVAIFLPTILPLLRSQLFSGSYPIPAIVWPGLIFNCLMHLIIWILLAGVCCLITRLIAYVFPIKDKYYFNIGISLWLIAVVTIFMANQYLFPRSLFADFTATLVPALLNQLLLWVMGIFLLLALLIATLGVIKYLLNHLRITSAILLILAVIGLSYALQQQAPTATLTKPNVIIIGIDSLRPDHLTINGNATKLAPNIDKFLAKTTNFTHASTPLGRTFPAWVSILTGQYPKQNGARYDLIEPHRVNIQQTLPKLLQQTGYQTVYGSDEKRFSNIDKSYGFDVTLGPKIGFNDFIIGSFNDFPLSNLISNTRFGKWLFPYNHSNRADNVIYHPATFSEEIKAFLAKKQRKPLFLVIHFCLSHWPYVWAAPPSAHYPPRTFPAVRKLYNASVHAVDQQFAQLWFSLQHNHLLDNAIVVILSDHGESLAFSGDRLTQASHYQNGDISTSHFRHLIKQRSQLDLDQSSGHGTDVLSPSQYHVVLAFRLFGQRHNIITNRDFPVSLVDIKPTILQLLNLKPTASDGISLAPYILNKNTPAPALRPIYIESGFAPDDISTEKFTLDDLVKLAVTYYKVNPETGRVEIKDSKAPTIIANKQRAILYGDWLFAIYPKNGAITPVLVNLTSKQWTDKLNSRFAKNSPLQQMLTLLRQEYKHEIKM